MNYIRDMLYIGQMGKGEKLYHYTSVDGLIGIITGKEFWVTKWDYLNDIDEFRIAQEVLIEILEENNVEERIIKDFQQKMKESFGTISSYTDDYFVLSFSLDPDSQLLWSSYSKQDGVNIEIDFEEFNKDIHEPIQWHGKVIYNREEQIQCIKRTLEEEFINFEEFSNIFSLNELNSLKEKTYEMMVTHMSVICTLYSMFFKRQCFENEKEYRFIFTNSGKNIKKTYFRNRNGLIVPYIKNQYENNTFIKSVTVGPTNYVESSIKGISNMLYHNGCPEIVRRSELPLRY